MTCTATATLKETDGFISCVRYNEAIQFVVLKLLRKLPVSPWVPLRISNGFFKYQFQIYEKNKVFISPSGATSAFFFLQLALKHMKVLKFMFEM